ncbi:MAG TPA: glycerol-3-phosphate 1-O-acyltransferase PlsY [Candidatus Eisenbacteria bacterium]
MPSLLAALALGYLSGSLPWGLWLPRAWKGVDVRTLGSRNLGATNVYRTLGPAIGIPVLLLDIAKGALPTWLVPGLALGATFPGGREWCRLAVGLAAVLGHVFTAFAGFKGGKGVATTAGVLLALSPPAFGVFAGVFVATVALTRFISLGSILGSVAFATTLALVAPGGLRSPTFAVGAAIALLVIVRHKDNIGRLARGEERRFSFRAGSA